METKVHDTHTHSDPPNLHKCIHTFTCEHSSVGVPQTEDRLQRQLIEQKGGLGGAYGPLAKVRLGHCLSAGCCLINLL